MLHQLALKQRLDEFEKGMLLRFLSAGSMQRGNLWQKNYLGVEPVAMAIENRNLDFIQIVAESEASMDRAWSCFFNTASFEFAKTLVTQLTPPKQTEYAKMREQQDQQGLSRFQYFEKLLSELRRNLQLRLEKGSEDPEELLKQITAGQQQTQAALECRSSMPEREKII